MNILEIEDNFKEFLSHFYHSGKKEIDMLGITFSNPIDANEIAKIYDKDKNKIIREIARVILDNDEKDATEISETLTKIAFRK